MVIIHADTGLVLIYVFSILVSAETIVLSFCSFQESLDCVIANVTYVCDSQRNVCVIANVTSV